MANRWRLVFAAAALVWPALFTIPYVIAPANAQSDAPPVGAAPVHREPVSACEACDWRALAARDALGDVLYDEKTITQWRSEIFEVKAWLFAHADGLIDLIYKQKADDLRDLEASAASFEKKRVEHQRKLDELMEDLAKCNASCKIKRPMTTLSSAAAVGTREEAVEAECRDCEAKALKLKADLARLRYAQFSLERPPTSSDRSEAEAEKDAQAAAVAQAQKDVAADRAALDACNKAHPRASCQPPTGTVTTPGTGTGGATGPKTSGQTTPQVGPGGTNLPGGKSIPEADAKNGAGAQTPRPPPGGPDTLPGSRENAPPIGPLPPIGSIFAPPPDALPGVQRFNFTTPSKLDDGHGTAEEYFTFIVRDNAGLDEVLALFRTEVVDVYGYQVTITAGNDPDKTRDKLEGLWYRGVIDYVEPDPCWDAAAGGSPVPVAGAWILYTPVSPSPSSDPGERAGDEEPPTIVRAGRDGTYTAPPRGLNEPIEMRVAKGCDERTTITSAGRSDRTPVAGVTPPVEEPPDSSRRITNPIRASELRKP